MLTRSVRRALAAGAAAAGALALVGSIAAPRAGAGQRRPDYVPGEVLVSYRPGATAVHARQAADGVGAFLADLLGDSGLQRLHLRPGVNVEAAVARLRADPAVAYAEPNYVYSIDREPNDPLFLDGTLWAMNNPNGANIDAPAAWDLSTGASDVAVAVVDTGVDYTHPDLTDNILRDSSGRVVGHDFYNGDDDPMDDNGHGSHVSGTIGAKGNNALGVVGVNWNVKIVPLKFLGRDGSGSTAAAVSCLDYAANLKRNGVNIVAANNSWGGGGYSQALADAIERCNNAGILFPAAAGNSGRNNDSTPSYPASFTNANVISVAATDSSDQLANFSNYGATTVHLGAPGVGIVSTVPGGRYANYSGTSMATPHVTGAVALLAAYDRSLSPAAIKAQLIGTGDAISSLAGRTITGRRLNLYNALVGGGTVNPPPPPPPSSALQVAMTLNKSSYKLGDTMVTRIHVSTGSTAVAGASVRLDLVTARGGQASGTATTSSTGDVSFSYRSRGSDGRGTWTETATATKSGFTSGTATITFTVR